MTLRSTRKTKKEYSLHEPIGADKEGNEINLLDILGTDIDEVLNQVDLRLETKKLYRCIDTVLKDRERVIVQLRYGLIDGEYRTQREIANILGIPRSYVSRIESRAIKKLSKAMEKSKIYRLDLTSKSSLCVYLLVFGVILLIKSLISSAKSSTGFPLSKSVAIVFILLYKSGSVVMDTFLMFESVSLTILSVLSLRVVVIVPCVSPLNLHPTKAVSLLITTEALSISGRSDIFLAISSEPLPLSSVKLVSRLGLVIPSFKSVFKLSLLLPNPILLSIRLLS